MPSTPRKFPIAMWPIADDGWPVLALAGIVTILLTLIYAPLGTFALGLMVWLAHVLRAPVRTVPDGTGLVLAPADGRIVEIADSRLPGDGEESPATRITIRTGLVDAQLQTVPIDGQIVDNFAIPGLFQPYDDMDLARADNERREITIQHRDGWKVVVVQLGGPTARQLVCRLPQGRNVSRGQPLGMVRLGGVVELFLPRSCPLRVVSGQRVVAGETIITSKKKKKAIT